MQHGVLFLKIVEGSWGDRVVFFFESFSSLRSFKYESV